MSDSIPTSSETSHATPVSPAVPTPLAAFLMQTRPTLALRSHQGVTTPYVFDEAEQEACSEVDGALDSAVALDLGWLARVAVTGEDRSRWLAGMTTNAVQTLAEGTGDYNFVLNAQGRIQGDLYTFREPDRLVLETTHEQVDRLVEHLDRFIIMDDVELHPLPGLTALGVVGPQAGDVLAKLGFDATQLSVLEQRAWSWNGIPMTIVHAYSTAIPRFELWFSAEHTAAVWTALLTSGCHPCGLRAAEVLRVAEGIPAYGVDILEKHLAQETSQIRALNFSKGCYLGQEIVERVRSRASIHRFLRQFSLDGAVPAAGVELHADGKPAGHLTSVATLVRNGKAQTFAIGMIRAEALSSKSKIEYDGGLASPLETPPKLTSA
jgi:folate-binding protein YgfZ